MSSTDRRNTYLGSRSWSEASNGRVNRSDLAYVGSITIDSALLDAVGLGPGEKVLVASNTSGQGLKPISLPAKRAPARFA
nr:aspartate 1-decarboxylase [Terricaulis silvestris]